MKNNRLVLLWLLVFFNLVIFSVAVPIWHGPDEQAHFGQVANIAEVGNKVEGFKNLNREIYESEVLLGTLRDERGNNKFTFHPEYRIEYTDSNVGLYEASIAAYPEEFRQEFIINEATVYPPLFYQFSSLFYKAGYELDLFGRVYAVRIFGWLLGVGTIILGYFFAKQLFPKNKLLQFTFLIMISFQPMLNFVFATVNSDNLFNFYFSACLLFGLVILVKGLRKNMLIPLLAILILGLFIKPQFGLILPIWLFSIFGGLVLHRNNKEVRLLSILSLVFGFFIPIAVILLQVFLRIRLFKTLDVLNVGFNLDLKDFVTMTIYRTYHETVPWYWGVFNWLGVVLPRIVNRTLNYLVVISIIGVVIGLVRQFYIKEKETFWKILYLIFCTVGYYLGIILFDLFYSNSTGGISIGMQGRYFFPTIFAHMGLILFGIYSLVSLFKNKLISEILIKLLGFGFIGLNFIGLFTILSSYYDLSSFTTFFNQLSQYKPLLFKHPFVYLIVVVYLFLLLQFIYTYLREKEYYEKNN